MDELTDNDQVAWSIEGEDAFGHDESHRLCVFAADDWVFIFGHAFCEYLQPLVAAGHRVAYRMFDNRAAYVMIYDPARKNVELWTGHWVDVSWAHSEIQGLSRAGCVDREFETFDAVLAFATSGRGPIAVKL